MYCPIRHPSRDTTRTTITCTYKTSNNEQVAFLPCSAQFCEFRSEIVTSYLNRMCAQMGSLPFVIFFLRQVMVAFVCFRIIVSVMSLGQKKGGKIKGRLPICWLVYDQHLVKKSHVQTRSHERGIASPPHLHCFGWPNSYVMALSRTQKAQCRNVDIFSR